MSSTKKKKTNQCAKSIFKRKQHAKAKTINSISRKSRDKKVENPQKQEISITSRMHMKWKGVFPLPLNNANAVAPGK